MRSGGSSKKDRCLPTWLTLNETNSIARPQQTEKMCSLREGIHVDSLFKCSIFGGNGVRGREGKGNPSYIYNWQSIITDLPLAQYLPHLPENCSPRISFSIRQQRFHLCECANPDSSLCQVLIYSPINTETFQKNK